MPQNATLFQFFLAVTVALLGSASTHSCATFATPFVPMQLLWLISRNYCYENRLRQTCCSWERATLVVARSQRQPVFILLCGLRKAMVILRSEATKNLQSLPRPRERHREGGLRNCNSRRLNSYDIPHILFVKSPVAYTVTAVRHIAFPAGREHEHEFHSVLERGVGTWRGDPDRSSRPGIHGGRRDLRGHADLQRQDLPPRRPHPAALPLTRLHPPRSRANGSRDGGPDRRGRRAQPRQAGRRRRPAHPPLRDPRQGPSRVVGGWRTGRHPRLRSRLRRVL